MLDFDRKTGRKGGCVALRIGMKDECCQEMTTPRDEEEADALPREGREI